MFSLSLSEQQSQISLPSCSKIPNRRVKISKIPDPEKPLGYSVGDLGLFTSRVKKRLPSIQCPLSSISAALSFNRKSCKWSDPPYINLADPLSIILSNCRTIQRL